MKTFLSSVMAGCAAIPDRHTATDSFIHGMGELSEIMHEVAVRHGRSGLAPGADGITGEVVDLAICLLDVIRLRSPGITDADINEEWFAQVQPSWSFFGWVLEDRKARTKDHDPDMIATALDRQVETIAETMAELLARDVLRSPACEEPKLCDDVNRLALVATEAAIALAALADPGLTEEALIAVAERKCAKWRRSVEEKNRSSCPTCRGSGRRALNWEEDEPCPDCTVAPAA
ncbi:hypothetical protein LAZ40_02375 [Cereibacter sphaeroides]|uniref:hypothetical protein n=1 Tax=Cereibacter sphaeroides TaxID=1063 RepID=UPI001F2370BD|nr:hypothetical protein [Cereibacter sphaeroides]MCE6957904.1 hypothetical protein [Cereibacter sphaeroides]MCE6971748.1 hypothetical protein [Cereibacter sphaeroides]